MSENTPSKGTSAVCNVCTIRTNVSALRASMPYRIRIVLTAKCHGPAPFGVGTITAILPTMKLTMAALKPSGDIKSKQRNVIQ